MKIHKLNLRGFNPIILLTSTISWDPKRLKDPNLRISTELKIDIILLFSHYKAKSFLISTLNIPPITCPYN
jgi:hypothetical protein